MWSASAREHGTLMGWSAAELRWVCAEAIGKSARTEGGKTDPSAAALDPGPESTAVPVIGAASAAALRRNWRRSTDMAILQKVGVIVVPNQAERPFFRFRPLSDCANREYTLSFDLQDARRGGHAVPATGDA